MVIILLLFGGKKLPELARGLGAGIHEFRRGMNGAGGATTEEVKEYAPERDVTPPTHKDESHRVQALPEPKARGGRPSARKSAGTQNKTTARKATVHKTTAAKAKTKKK